MKSIKSIYLLVAAAAFGMLAASCQRAEEYEPAAKETGAQVFFMNTNDSQAGLLSTDTEYKLTLGRVETSSALTVNLAASGEATEYITVPSSVSFAAGAETTELTLTFDASKMTPNEFYPLTIKITDESLQTLYGESCYDMTIGVAIPWQEFATGKFIASPDFDDYEEEDHTLIYQDLGGGIYNCKIDDVFAGVDYCFIWDTNTNWISVPMQKTGYTSGGMYIYFSDAEGFFGDYLGGALTGDALIEYAYTKQGYNRPHYDGNGGFYLGDFFHFAAADKKGSGWSFGGEPDIFIADGFIRLDFTTEISYGGMLVGADNTSTKAIINLKSEGDLPESIKWAASQTATPDELLEGILNGDALEFSGEVTPNADSLSTVYLDGPVGLWTIVTVPVSGGEMFEGFAASKVFKYPGIGASTGLELMTGNYTGTDYYGYEYTLIVEADPDDATGTKFTVKNLGIKNGLPFYAEFDPEAATLTVDGTAVGLEKYGSLFGKGGFFYFNADKTQVYGWEVYASAESDGSDPLIFNVDGSGFITTNNEEFAVVVYDLDDNPLGGYSDFEAGTEFSYSPLTAASSKRSVGKKLIPGYERTFVPKRAL